MTVKLSIFNIENGFVRLLKITNLYEHVSKKIYTEYCSAEGFMKKNSCSSILLQYLKSEIKILENSINKNPYDKVYLKQYGLSGTIKYKDILENEKNILIVLFLRCCYRYNICSTYRKNIEKWLELKKI